MNTNQMNAILEVAKEKSISKAAKNLFIAQPNLSKLIIDVEKELSFDIFIRDKSGLSLTTKGALFIDELKEIAKTYNRIKQLSYLDIDEYVFRISIPREHFWYSKIIDYLLKKSSKSESFRFEIDETTNIDSFKNIKENGYNCGIVRYSVKEKSKMLTEAKLYRMNFLPLCSFKFGIVVNVNNPLSKLKKIKRNDIFETLKDYTIIEYGDRKNSKLHFDFSFKKVILVYDRGSILELMQHNPDIIFFAPKRDEDFLNTYNLAFIECEFESNSFEDALCYNDKIDEDFLTFIKNISF